MTEPASRRLLLGLSIEELLLAAWLACGAIVAVAVFTLGVGVLSGASSSLSAVPHLLAQQPTWAMLRVLLPLAAAWAVGAPWAVWKLEKRRLANLA